MNSVAHALPESTDTAPKESQLRDVSAQQPRLPISLEDWHDSQFYQRCMLVRVECPTGHGAINAKCVYLALCLLCRPLVKADTGQFRMRLENILFVLQCGKDSYYKVRKLLIEQGLVEIRRTPKSTFVIVHARHRLSEAVPFSGPDDAHVQLDLDGNPDADFRQGSKSDFRQGSKSIDKDQIQEEHTHARGATAAQLDMAEALGVDVAGLSRAQAFDAIAAAKTEAGAVRQSLAASPTPLERRRISSARFSQRSNRPSRCAQCGHAICGGDCAQCPACASER